MAKQKKKDEHVSSHDSTTKQDNVTSSSLNETNFSTLRDKIQAKLQHAKPQTAKPKAKGKEQSHSKKPSLGVEARGSKRKADGTVIAEQNSSTKQNAPIGNLSDTIDAAELKKIVKELGGTDEDLDLIAGADSESEVEGLEDVSIKNTKSKDGKSLQDGMSNILKEIALAQGKHGQESSETDESEQEELDAGDSEAQIQGILAIEKKATVKGVEKQPNSARKENPNQKGRSRFKCEPRPDWYAAISEVDLSKEKFQIQSRQSVDSLRAFAWSLLEDENEIYKSTQQSSSSQSFYNTVIASGTLSDRISALTLAVQESPLHNIKALDTLISLAGKRSRAQAIEVLQALKDLFAQGSLLPSERRLYTFVSHPLVLSSWERLQSWKKGDPLPTGIEESDLICVAFEDWLKEKYFDVLKVLEIWCNDEIEFARTRAVSFVYELLKERPEQESNLLRLLVNKIGDPVKRIASQTSYLLMQLLISHPAMKMVVVSFVESDFLFRPGQSMHGQYYAVTTLNQTALSAREEDVANKLLDVYFALFTTLLKVSVDQGSGTPQQVVSTTRAQRQRKRIKGKSDVANSQMEELREKLISAVLTGVNRAYPYVGTDQKNFDKHLDTLFQITHSANFNTAVQAMMLIQQLTSTHGAAADRFYRTLYESLLDPRLATASKQQLYLNLLHRSLKSDLNVKRVKAFTKRILQIMSLHDPSFICGAFFLLKDLESAFPSISTLLSQPEQQDDESDEESFHDVDDTVPTQALQKEGKNTLVQRSTYDGNKRAPEHSNAESSCAWEVLPFLAHYHPSVSVTADTYLEQQSKLPGKPDLSLHSLIHFLDRFVYRNPKLASNRMRGASVMQPMANDDAHGILIGSTAGSGGPAVNTEAFRSKKDDEVAADDVFFHKYFTALGKDAKSHKSKNARVADEDGSIGDEDEDAIWKAMIDSAPDLEGVSSDEDLDMSSLEDDDDEDSLMDDALSGDASDSGVDIEDGIFDDEDEEDDQASIPEQLSGSDTLEDGIDFADLPDSGRVDTKATSDQKQRKRLKSLPTFASAADYAKMIEDDEDEDLGT